MLPEDLLNSLEKKPVCLESELRGANSVSLVGLSGYLVAILHLSYITTSATNKKNHCQVRIQK